jgi:hypothetical protein
VKLTFFLMVAAAAAIGCASEQRVAPPTEVVQPPTMATQAQDSRCQVVPIIPADRSLCANEQDREGCLKKFAVTAEHTSQVLKQAESCLAESNELLNAEIKKSTR